MIKWGVAAISLQSKRRTEMFIEGMPMIGQGLTQYVCRDKTDERNVVLIQKGVVTAFGDPSRSATFPGKAENTATAVCNTFELLKEAGIPVAYRGPYGVNGVVEVECITLPLIVGCWRYATGSILERMPEHKGPDTQPYRFPKLEQSFFLKTRNGVLTYPGGRKTRDLRLNNKTNENPLIVTPDVNSWLVVRAELPVNDGSQLHLEVDPVCTAEDIAQMRKLARRAFLVLERAWGILGYHLLDVKFEFGFTNDEERELVIADVVGPDQWRLHDGGWHEVGKQKFRESGKVTPELELDYAKVARLTASFHIPRQVIIYWLGSESDGKTISKVKVAGVNIQTTIRTPLHNPRGFLHLLETAFSQYPQGGVIIALGKNNAVAPMVAGQSPWPTLSVPSHFNVITMDSLSLPLNVPVGTVGETANALMLAFQILGISNPAAYAFAMEAKEQYDRRL